MTDVAGMQTLLDRQKAANIAEGPPSLALRIDRLNRAIAILVDNQAALIEALNEDFGSRSRDASLLTDIVGTLAPLKAARASVAKWMRPERRKAEFPFNVMGAKSELRFMPKGVVGVISPWNFPVNLTFAPLGGILAAGNRVLIKPSEYTPATSELMKTLIAKSFDELEMAVFPGGPEIGTAFAHLAFDHLLFTGGTSIGRHVMRAASENLVPVTLELGGKSPAILGRGADLSKAAARIMTGKTLNAGQICLAPDYVLAPHASVDQFVTEARTAVTGMFPTLRDNPDYTAIISTRHHERLTAMVADAKAKGAEVVELNPAGEDFSQQEHRKIPPTLVLEPTDDMLVMQDEIFGPILPVKSYAGIDEAIAYVNGNDRPLGLYYFGDDAGERERVLERTMSGGVTVNDVIYHIAQEDLPFGGIGPSGMGAYHGREGFLEFSHRRSVYRQTGNDLVGKIMRPPFTDMFRKQMGQRLTK
jgi:coniferyl-aldehyde dehydrogenase